MNAVLWQKCHWWKMPFQIRYWMVLRFILVGLTKIRSLGPISLFESGHFPANSFQCILRTLTRFILFWSFQMAMSSCSFNDKVAEPSTESYQTMYRLLTLALLQLCHTVTALAIADLLYCRKSTALSTISYRWWLCGGNAVNQRTLSVVRWNASP